MMLRARTTTATAPEAPRNWSNASFARVAELARIVAGLVFPPSRYAGAEAGMRRAMSTLRISEPATLADAIAHPGAARDAVLAELTVGESYFFRDAAQFEVLACLVEQRAESGDTSPIRVWSAGCAAGEEPYTIAILLRELGWTGRTRITGTDVARPRLAAARRGLYTRWALRGISDERLTRWFTRVGPHFALDPRIREAVTFEQLNLAIDDYPSGEHPVGNQDLVLCRNVMIYFDPPTIERIAKRLMAALAPKGWLVLGASDPMIAPLVDCDVVQTRAGLAYRHRTEPSEPAVQYWPVRAVAPSTAILFDDPPYEAPAIAHVAPAPRLEPTVAPDAHNARAAYDARDYVRAEALVRGDIAAVEPSSVSVEQWTLLVRTLANVGKLEEAGEVCARAIELQVMSPELHYLYATLLSQAGWHNDAALAARRSVYLDRKYVMGHMVLGNALSQLGDTAGAARAFGNVLDLLTDVPADAAMPAADGVPAGRLRQIASSLASAVAAPQ